jgi:hypothetical protein
MVAADGHAYPGEHGWQPDTFVLPYAPLNVPTGHGSGFVEFAGQ